MLKLSIIIASYNSSGTLPLALDSILEQTYSNLEVIIVDGCSTDNTVELVRKRYCRENIRCVVGEDFGIYDAMNKGVALATGDWIFFMGADDRLHDNNVLMDMLGHERSKEQYGAVVGDIVFDNNKIRKSSVSFWTQCINTVHHQSAFYSRALFIPFKYNETYKVSADYELNLLIFLERIKVLKVDRVVCIVGLSGASNKVDFSGYAEEIKIRNKYLSMSPLRLGMNFMTCMRYAVKKTGRLVGCNFHFYR